MRTGIYIYKPNDEVYAMLEELAVKLPVDGNRPEPASLADGPWLENFRPATAAECRAYAARELVGEYVDSIPADDAELARLLLDVADAHLTAEAEEWYSGIYDDAAIGDEAIAAYRDALEEDERYMQSR